MSALVWARVLPALLVMPLGPVPARLAAGAVLALALSAWAPAAPADLFVLAAEAALGALLGVLVGLPVWAATALRGEAALASLGLTGQVVAWSTFFAMGGGAMLFAGLAQTLAALPPGAWPAPDQIVERTGLLFYGLFWLGLPSWLVAVWVAPTAGWIDRLSRSGLGLGVATAARPILSLLALVALLPVLLDVVREMFTAVLGG